MSENTCVIGEAFQVRGSIIGSADLVVEGRIEGEIETAGSVVLRKTARVDATITANNVQIEGTLVGDVAAHGHVTIGPEAQVTGTVAGKAVSVAEGAKFKGRLDMALDLDKEASATHTLTAAASLMRRGVRDGSGPLAN